jgi:hypothetical protein
MSSLDEQMYKKKYLKYKNKYIQLKEYQGGIGMKYDSVYIFAEYANIIPIQQKIINGSKININDINFIYNQLNDKGYKIYEKNPKLLELITKTTMSEVVKNKARNALTKKPPQILFTKYVKDILSCVTKIYQFTDIINYNIQQKKFSDDDIKLFNNIFTDTLTNNRNIILTDLINIDENSNNYKDLTMEIPEKTHLNITKKINTNYNNIKENIDTINDVVSDKLDKQLVTYIRIQFTNRLKTKGLIYYEPSKIE